MPKSGSLLTRLKGKITRPIADAAGDRRSEAKARVEAATGTKPDDATLKVVEHRVRERHGDVQPHRRDDV